MPRAVKHPGDVENLPHLPGWLTPPQIAEILGINRQTASQNVSLRKYTDAFRVGKTAVVSAKEIFTLATMKGIDIDQKWFEIHGQPHLPEQMRTVPDKVA